MFSLGLVSNLQILPKTLHINLYLIRYIRYKISALAKTYFQNLKNSHWSHSNLGQIISIR